jgi:uncharacterized protein (DUF433 family)
MPRSYCSRWRRAKASFITQATTNGQRLRKAWLKPGVAKRLRYRSAMKQPIVSRSLDVMGGTAVFHATRIPLQSLLDYLEGGETIDDFLEGFPSVTREHVIAFLEEAKDRVIEAAS